MDILERLQSATEPSRELDARIELSRRRFLFGAAAVAGAVIGGDVPAGWIAGIGDQPIKAPRYSESIDAALTLLPGDGLVHEMGHLSRTDRRWHVVLAIPGDMPQSVHVVPAIAIAIASLKAIASMKSRSGTGESVS